MGEMGAELGGWGLVGVGWSVELGWGFCTWVWEVGWACAALWPRSLGRLPYYLDLEYPVLQHHSGSEKKNKKKKKKTAASEVG